MTIHALLNLQVQDFTPESFVRGLGSAAACAFDAFASRWDRMLGVQGSGPPETAAQQGRLRAACKPAPAAASRA